MTCALITGGSRGIGAACARALAARGYDIALTYQRGKSAADDVVRELEAAGAKAAAYALDLGQPTQKLGESVKALLEQTGPIDVLVHNAGQAQDALLPMMRAEAWDEVLAVNLLSFYALMRPVARQMLRARKGRIVTVASMSGVRGNAGQCNYAASKAGLIGATKSLALELAPRGITANSVAPGLIETDMTQELEQEKLTGMIPLGRFGSASEVAECVAFLCSDAASYVTGQVLGVNGGLYT